ncbi:MULTISPECIES: tyrosine recombinase XerC [unclassified Nostoc]|uniref:site-specific integrase n=1 Tax=unclassified Nostoc TaxID=2593658 RepID=UPI002AD4B883|nr:tyrosine-type recombinase/integrase [Nostoc sp. DedQUE03]MDZ7977415.1 tyrosine-type recombinase/integrase [Nostoc sp. DedQUE03]MDZ8043625.1 tyrosine-type recombinase/integrase [Nostoc sp. DedQUE02]
MVNSSKTPTGKAKKGQVTVRIDSGSVKACFPRSYCNKGQIKLATGISLVDGWESKASQLQRRLQIELEDGKLDDGEGNFDLGRYQEILKEYGLQARLRLVKTEIVSDDRLPPKPELSLMEVWDMYCSFRRESLSETVYQLKFRGEYLRAIKKSLDKTGESPLEMRNWLLINYSHSTVKRILSCLSEAYRLAIKQKKVNENLFDGMAEDINTKTKRERVIDQNKEIENDDDVLDKSKAYTWDEAQEILKYIQSDSSRVKHYYNLIKFKFLTGCRTGEAIAIWWVDVEWDKERILLRRNYNNRLKIYKSTKNDTTRMFPMPKNGELWNLLKSIPQGEPNENLFKNKAGKAINSDSLQRVWHGYEGSRNKGIIPELIKQGKVKRYLPCYNTRHTFITHQIFDLGRDAAIVNAWCEHSEEMSRKHYRDIARYATQINPELPVNQHSQQQSELDLLKEQLRNQQELIDKLLQDKQ